MACGLSVSTILAHRPGRPFTISDMTHSSVLGWVVPL